MTDRPPGTAEEDWLVEALRVVRTYGPEILDQVAALATSLADTLREPGGRSDDVPTTAVQPPPSGTGAPRFERIEVSE